MLCYDMLTMAILANNNYLSLPKTNTEEPMTTAFPIFPKLSATIPAKHPNPPPSIVPSPRSNPLLNVAPAYVSIIMVNTLRNNTSI
ncbi:hypothetical protein HanHA300_Chr11g0408441 [Helianthus annuus]|nr:hypothetical protein HanHA300_Chr11g0408441 [Helianthus annuus]KAJ0510033.1 hypothetical protein HanIR_Chr11g0536031 [Helianthus annuus]KAJ0517991.1 hypothetical protein HanHA89_Chr11g0432141 [Helianthus annuus]KAJ0686011.1 hypothetical protein HanLR1_Chr11g0409681 [Helianthus annuus]